MGTDKTLLVILMAIASVAMGVWDLWKGRARDVLLAVSLAEGALLAGAALEALFPGGIVVGLAVATIAGVKSVSRIGAAREEELKKALGAVPDVASRLLVLHDRVDGRTIEETGLQKAGRMVLTGCLGLVGVGMMAMGLTYDVWQASVVGIGMAFFPLSHLTSAVTASQERARLGSMITSLEKTEDLLVSGIAEGKEEGQEVTRGRMVPHG